MKVQRLTCPQCASVASRAGDLQRTHHAGLRDVSICPATVVALCLEDTIDAFLKNVLKSCSPKERQAHFVCVFFAMVHSLFLRSWFHALCWSILCHEPSGVCASCVMFPAFPDPCHAHGLYRGFEEEKANTTHRVGTPILNPAFFVLGGVGLSFLQIVTHHKRSEA